MFDAVIYDMDGLIIDSGHIWTKIQMEVFSSVGLHLANKDFQESPGLRLEQIIDFWWERSPWKGKTKEQVHGEVISKMLGYIELYGVEMKGVSSSIQYFKRKGLKLGVASSSIMKVIKATVNKLEIEDYFDELVSAEYESFGKPHPAVFLKTAEKLRVRPERCLVLEDSFNGLLAAKAARMKCAVVPLPKDFNDKKLVIADWKLKSLEDVAYIFD